MRKYPRQGCAAKPKSRGFNSLSTASACKHLVQFGGIKTDHDLIADDNGGGGTAVIGPDQFEYRLLVGTDVFHFELDPSLREVGLGRMAGRSARLAVDHNFLL